MQRIMLSVYDHPANASGRSLWTSSGKVWMSSGAIKCEGAVCRIRRAGECAAADRVSRAKRLETSGRNRWREVYPRPGAVFRCHLQTSPRRLSWSRLRRRTLGESKISKVASAFSVKEQLSCRIRTLLGQLRLCAAKPCRLIFSFPPSSSIDAASAIQERSAARQWLLLNVHASAACSLCPCFSRIWAR